MIEVENDRGFSYKNTSIQLSSVVIYFNSLIILRVNGDKFGLIFKIININETFSIHDNFINKNKLNLLKLVLPFNV